MKKESIWKRFCGWIESMIDDEDIGENPYSKIYTEEARKERRRWDDEMTYIHKGGHMKFGR